ncbi:MAG: lysophospholipid acyltransferase family protein [Acidimicrobiales bacterium]
MHHLAARSAASIVMGIRTQVNRVVVAVALLVLLLLVVIVDRLRDGSGRQVACWWIRGVGRICGVRFTVRGGDRLDPAAKYVFVPNHSSLLDIPAMLLADQRVRFLAAAELFRVPLLAAGMQALGTERIDRHDTGTAHRQLAVLAGEEGPRALVVFAEGGIAPLGRRRPFKTGAFVLAIESGASVVPVAIHHTSSLLPPGANLALRPGLVIVDLLDPIPTTGCSVRRDRRVLRDRVQEAVLRRLAEEPSDDCTSARRGIVEG